MRLRRWQGQRLASLVINERPNVAQSQYDLLKATIHDVARFSPDSQNRGSVTN
ncbi:MAG: hypothetical protein M0005_13445 [Actinomycetota bacterium]|jgi:hypothetical protein|nr:hypothetical protein [Actinomycetota bacterium]